MQNKTLPPASCDNCGVSECPLHLNESFAEIAVPGQAWLLDERWEEFEKYLNGSGAIDPRVFLPWPSRLGKAAYAWNLPERAAQSAAPLLTLRRSLAMRRLTPTGRRQEILQDFDRQFARSIAKRLSYKVTNLVIWQNLLPYLVLDKTLGGRKYDVLLWRAPRHLLHSALAEAHRRYPESKTLGDFRSSTYLADAEKFALANARRIITPHQQLAQIIPNKTILLKWASTAFQARASGRLRIAFLGPTLGRRGAYVVRQSFRKLGCAFIVVGRNLESQTFWQGLPAEERPLDSNWLNDVGLVVAPALMEFRPRLILSALAQGVPVIATEACGLHPTDNLYLVDPYDAEALAEKIERLRPR